MIATALRVPQWPWWSARYVWLALFGQLLAISLLRSLRAGDGRRRPRLRRSGRCGCIAGARPRSWPSPRCTSRRTSRRPTAWRSTRASWTPSVWPTSNRRSRRCCCSPCRSRSAPASGCSPAPRTARRFSGTGCSSMSALYCAVPGAHTIATAWLFRDLSFRAASGGQPGVFGDPSFLAYYVLGPLAVFAHVAGAARSLLIGRLGPLAAERWAKGVLGAGCAATLVIALALCGIHYRNDRDKPSRGRRAWAGADPAGYSFLQRAHRVHPQRAPRGQVTREESDGRSSSGTHRESAGRRRTRNSTALSAAPARRPRDASARPRPTPMRPASCPGRHHPEMSSRSAPERHADADLARALGHRVGHHAVDADRGQQQRQPAKTPSSSAARALARPSATTRLQRAARRRRAPPDPPIAPPRAPPAHSTAGHRTCARRA